MSLVDALGLVLPGRAPWAEPVVMLVTGPAKAEAVHRSLEGPEDVDACPGQLARHAHWLLDPEAARLLRHTGTGR